MNIITISSFMELFETVKELNRDNKYWFRGHANVDYILNPSAYRNIYTIADNFGRPVEPKPVREFNNRGDKIFIPDKLYMHSFFEKLDENNIKYDKSMNIVDKYCLAQHYGVWTPMLDWSTDFIVALFFACDGRKSKQDCAVFLLDPIKWNESMLGEGKILDSEEVIKVSDIFPLAMKGKKDDKRMCRQSGNFVVHGTMVWPLEHYYVEDDVLIKIVILSKIAEQLSLYLKAFGVTRDSIYVCDDEKDKISNMLKEINHKALNDILDEFREEWINTPDDEKGVSRTYF